MPEITINGESTQYVGQPLVAYTFDGECWSGRSNLQHCNAPATLQLTDLEECFHWMAQWKVDTGYRCGYVMDFTNRTIYYDKEESLNHLTLKVIPKRKLDGHFQSFIQKEF